MARKITVFELHLDGVRFGPSIGGDDEGAMDEEMAETAGGSDGSRGLRTVLAVIGVLAALSILGRLAARRNGGDGGIEVGEVAVEGSIEQ